MKFESLGLIEELKTTRETLINLLTETAKRYLKNPYHNFTHAVCLMHILHVIALKIDTSLYFSKLEVACMFLAALGHDIGHLSTNNAFSIRNKDVLSIIYNDKSVLENYHISLFF